MTDPIAFFKLSEEIKEHVKQMEELVDIQNSDYFQTHLWSYHNAAESKATIINNSYLFNKDTKEQYYIECVILEDEFPSISQVFEFICKQRKKYPLPELSNYPYDFQDILTPSTPEDLGQKRVCEILMAAEKQIRHSLNEIISHTYFHYLAFFESLSDVISCFTILVSADDKIGQKILENLNEILMFKYECEALSDNCNLSKVKFGLTNKSSILKDLESLVENIKKSILLVGRLDAHLARIMHAHSHQKQVSPKKTLDHQPMLTSTSTK